MSSKSAPYIWVVFVDLELSKWLLHLDNILEIPLSFPRAFLFVILFFQHVVILDSTFFVSILIFIVFVLIIDFSVLLFSFFFLIILLLHFIFLTYLSFI